MQIFNSLNTPKLSSLLQSGGVGILPTDTVYGLVCPAANEAAVRRLYKLKNRHAKPGTIIAANVDQLVSLGIKRRYLTAVEQFWPNPISVEVPCGPELAYLHDGHNALAVRVPDDRQLQSLLAKVGPLMTSSANQPGEPVATNLNAAKAYFADSVDFYVDIGELGDRPSSTVIRMVDDAIEVLRPGAITIDEFGRMSGGTAK